MGSFFLTSKKASATLVFLVISILLVSSGVIIVHEVEKSNNENNIAGTGLVLLDTEQDTSQYSDSSDDRTKLFTFGDSGGKSSSKKSSGGGGSIDSQIYNEPEIPDNDEIIDNQTSDNQTFVDDTEEEDLNSSESTNISIQFSDGHIFEENGTVYIVRDNAIYALASSEQIRFNPPLPLSICVGEVIDIPIDLGTVDLKWGVLDSGYISCVINGQKDISIDYCLMEADTWSADDQIKCGYATATTFDCETLDLERYYSIVVKRIFTGVKLSDFFGGIEDPNTIEVYAKVSNYNNYFYTISTSTYDVDKEPNCDCLSGACCDLSSRPYKFKPYGSQPTGKTDSYYCSGTNSPTGTSSVIKRDYYCTGSSASYT